MCSFVLLRFVVTLLVVLVALPAGPANAQETPIPRDLAAFVLGYRDRMPKEENSRRYRWDESSIGEVAEIVTALRLANRGTETGRQQAAEILVRYAYRLEWVKDTVSRRRFLLAYEQEPCQRCWGLYVLRYDTSSAPENVAVEVPHPFHDEFSPELGMQLFRELDAKMFAIAGTHRYANGYKSKVSDMARSYVSVFHKVHANFTTTRTHVVQVHGFAARPDYPQVVLSNGTPTAHWQLNTFAARLRARGVPAGVFDGQNYKDLGATINPQGRHTNKKGGFFYHVEPVYPLRAEPRQRALLVEELANTVFRDQNSCPPDTMC